MNCLSNCITGSKTSSDKKKMAGIFRRRALYTDAKQAKHTFVSLGGYLEERQTRREGEKTSLIFEYLSIKGFLHKCGIRNGDRLISVNFVQADRVFYDLLVEAIGNLRPLVLGVERTTKDGIVTIYAVMEILADKQGEPYLKFHGIYFWKVAESLTTDMIRSFIPIEVKLMTLYRYDSSVSGVTITAKKDNEDYWLTVDEDKIEFRKQDSAKAVFTVYKYDSDKLPQIGTPVILVPKCESSQCLSATDELTLAPFHETCLTGPEPIPGNAKFLLMEAIEEKDEYKIESSESAGYYLAMGPDDEAIMSENYTIFTLNEEPGACVTHPPSSS